LATSAGFINIIYHLGNPFTYLRHLKGQCQEIFCFRFFHESSSPQAPENIIRVVSNFFLKIEEIFTSQGEPQVSTSPAANFASGTTDVVATGGK
jgi:hypothetical protein